MVNYCRKYSKKFLVSSPSFLVGIRALIIKDNSNNLNNWLPRPVVVHERGCLSKL